MTVTRTLTRSFAGGEIAPELMGRMDLDKFMMSLKECRNWIPLAHGPIRTRPGTKFVNYGRDGSQAVRLLPFQWSNDQTMILEFGHEYIHFHTDGQTLLNDSQTITSITCGSSTSVSKTSHGYSDGDMVYFTGITGTAASMLNGRFLQVVDSTANTFGLLQMNGDQVVTTGLTATVTSAAMATAYKVTTPYQADDLFEIRFVQNSDVLTLTHEDYAPRQLSRLGATNWQLATISFGASLPAPAGSLESRPYVSATVPSGGGYTMFNGYVVAAVNDEDEESAPSGVALYNKQGTSTVTNATVTQITDASQAVISINSTTGIIAGSGIELIGLSAAGSADEVIAYNLMNGQILDVVSVSAGASVTVDVDTSAMSANLAAFAGTVKVRVSTVDNNLGISGAKNTIYWSAVSGASYYRVYKSTIPGGVYGYIGRTTSTSFVDNNITPDTTRTAPEAEAAFDSAGDYPRCCTYYEQRRIFGATTNDPQTIWMTQTGTESNLLSSVPSRDSDAIRFRMASRDHNSILHVVPMNDLIILTSAAEWRAYAPNGDPITPSSLVVRTQSFSGSSAVTPALTAGSMIYVQQGGWSLRELAYSWESQSYKSTDITAMAPHLFQDQAVVDMTFQRVPIPILWVVMDSGELISCTYMPEHKVIAFAKHDTSEGYFESVTTVVEGDEDAVYFVVRRTDDNGETVRTVERLANMRQISEIANAFQVDSGLSYSGAAVTSLSGLWHLEGKTVSVLTDGAVHPQVTVTDGAIDLDYEAEVVHVGLPIAAQAETMPLVFEVEDGGVGNVKAINRVWLKVKNTSGLKVGPDTDDLVDATTRSDEMYGSPPALQNGVIEVPLLPAWSDEGTLILRSDDPLPAIVLSISYEVAIDA
jgi:hypothetical protein